jgi:Flp pilus assembly protein TadD
MHLIKSGRGAKVFGILEDMVQRRPTDPDLTDRLVNLYMRQKKPQKAVEILDRLGNAQFDANQTAAGVVTLKKILSLNPPNRKDYEQLLQQLSGK